jgi:hypothetical protein
MVCLISTEERSVIACGGARKTMTSREKTLPAKPGPLTLNHEPSTEYGGKV